MPDPRFASDTLSHLLLEQAPACQWVLNGDFVFVGAFGGAERVFHRRADELTGRRLEDVVPASALDFWKERIGRALRGETSFHTISEADRPAFAITLFPLRDESGIIRWAGGLAVDVTQSDILERQLRATALRVLSAQEEEHARLSRFLHDEMGQSLTAVGMQLDILRMDLEASVPDIGRRTAEIQSLLEVVVNRIRDLSYELNPGIVERAGFHSAMDRLAGRYRRTFAGTLRLLADSSIRVRGEIGSAMYKIAQEAIENSIRHAACTQIEVLVKATQSGPTLEVHDNGCGFIASQCRPRLGLMLMEYYAAQVGLRLELDSQPGKGTRVRAFFDPNFTKS